MPNATWPVAAGADYEAAHDGIARAATAAAAAQRGGRGHGGRPAYQAPMQQSYQPQPSYQPAPVYGGQPGARASLRTPALRQPCT